MVDSPPVCPRCNNRGYLTADRHGRYLCQSCQYELRALAATTDTTCESRIDGYMAGRLETIAALIKANEADTVDDLTDEELSEIQNLATPDRSEYEGERGAEKMREAAREVLYEMPLAVEAGGLVRVTLGTGRPGDWLEAEVDEDGEIGRITYWFNDWFDSAHRVLAGDDYATAEAFVRHVAAL